MIEVDDIGRFVGNVLWEVRQGIKQAKNQGVKCDYPDGVEFELPVNIGSSRKSVFTSYIPPILRFTVPMEKSIHYASFGDSWKAMTFVTDTDDDETAVAE